MNKNIFKIMRINLINKNSGQAMLLSIFLICTGVLAFTAIAGYFMAQRIRNSSDITDSAKAILAADSGLECELYNTYNIIQNSNFIKTDCSNLPFSNDARASTVVSLNGNTYTLKSYGISRRSSRAFMAQVSQ